MGDFSKLRDEVTPPERLPWDQRIPDESAQALTRRIKGMLCGDEYIYAEETLRGILATVDRTQRCTAGQVRAVDNIQQNPYNDGAYNGAGQRWRR